MRTVFRLVAKDLARKRRAPLGFVVVLLFPVVFAALLGLAFGRGDGPPKIRLLLQNRDDGFLSRALASAFTSERSAEFLDVRVVGDEGRAILDRGGASALLVIPEHFTTDLLEGEPITLSLVRNPAEGILPEIAEQLAAILADGLDASSRVLRGPLARIRGFASDGKVRIEDAAIADVAVEVKRTIEGAESLVFPPVITLEGAFGADAKEQAAGTRGFGDVFLLVLPGVAVYALFLLGDQGMRDLLTESTEGTLRRQLAGPVRPATIVAGKALYSGALSGIGLVVLTFVGALALRRGVDPVGYLAMGVGTILAVTGVASVLYGFARTERQGATTSSVVYLVLAFAGGAFFPISNLPAALRTFSAISPFRWGTEGFRALLEPGAGAGAVMPHAGILAAIGVASLAIGSWALSRTARRGGAA
ncbi:MAG TPA: ABC transporter permease [Candidatus Polarisedimenticolaceae bacterium]